MLPASTTRPPADLSTINTTAGASPVKATPALIVALALVYAMTGGASMTFAIPPGYASALFPAAGVALVAALVFGTRGVLAVLLGSMLLNLALGMQHQSASRGAWLLPGVLGVGAALQAMLGAALVGRSERGPLTLDSPVAILRLFGLGGLLAGVVGATIGTSALGLAGVISPDRLALNWLTWWSGDALGVMAAAPVALAFIGQPASAWRPRRLSVALPLLVAMALMAGALWQVEKWQRSRDEARFERDASSLVTKVDLRLRAHLDALDAMHSLYVASRSVSGEEFRQASRVWLNKLPGVQALGWHERVARENIPRFEALARADGLTDYRVIDRDLRLSAGDSEVYAMRLIEPRAGNDTALGINVLSIPAARAAVERAAGSDAPVATAPFRLTQETGGQKGMVAYRAVHGMYGPGGAPPLGTVFLTLRMDTALAQLTQGAPAYLRACLIDTQAAAGARRLAGPEGCENENSASPLQHHGKLSFAGQTWELRIDAPGGLPSASDGGDHGTAWLFSLAALVATGMMGALLLIVTGRTRRTELAVAERTEALRHQISERRLAEVALGESERRFRGIFQSVPVGVIYTDLQGRIKQCNTAFCAMTGYSERELAGMPVSSFTHPDDRAADQSAREALLAGDQPLYRRDKRYITKDGQTLWVAKTMSLLRNEAGKPHRFIGVVEDFTEHRQLEAAESARERAEASNRAKSEFLSRMSHELRTPLNAMLGFSQLLELDQKDRLAERHRQWMAQIQQAGWHLLDMINDVLDLSRIESGSLSLQPEPLPLEPLLVASMALVAPQAAERDITLTRSMATHGPLNLMADATRVKQILTNLLSNAIKYNRDGGEVRIGTQVVEAPGAPQLELTVTDTGLGMSPQQLASLFQPFNRLGRERSGAEGTGIGLVIAKLLAERHGGSLEARSEAGKGSTFRLLLPLTAEKRMDSVAGSLDEQEAHYNRRHVLYIEDNEINVEVMRGMLAQRPQIHLVVATTGLDGLAAVRTAPPDLILLDMNLPDISGMALLQHLQADERTAGIPVVVVSADALQAQIDATLEAGAARYLTKPLSVGETLAVIDEELAQLVTRFG